MNSCFYSAWLIKFNPDRPEGNKKKKFELLKFRVIGIQLYFDSVFITSNTIATDVIPKRLSAKMEIVLLQAM